MDAMELAVLRKQTTQFINENPTSVVFNRMIEVGDGAGGKTRTPTPQTAQNVRVVEQNRAIDLANRTVSGEMTKPEIKVLARWDANINVNDTFSWHGLNWEVTWIVDMPYEKTVEVKVV